MNKALLDMILDNQYVENKENSPMLAKANYIPFVHTKSGFVRCSQSHSTNDTARHFEQNEMVKAPCIDL